MAYRRFFKADAVLFDMDGTLTDSIAAVEAALSELANEVGLDIEHVKKQAHGRRAIDFIANFKPHIPKEDLPEAVAAFERRILYFADEYMNNLAEVEHTYPPTPRSVPTLSPASSATASSANPSPAIPPISLPAPPVLFLDEISVTAQQNMLLSPDVNKVVNEIPKVENFNPDRSIRSLPGVHAMIASIPDGRYAVATSGATTYAYGAMTRVGIVPPPVTITADDPRLKRGKPHPDPFLLAAENLGFEASKCVVFEDSPSGIQAAVASGATVIAVCTSHPRSKIQDCGAHYIVETMEQVKCKLGDDGGLAFTVQL